MKIKKCTVYMIVLIIGAISCSIYLFLNMGMDKRNTFCDTQVASQPEEVSSNPSITEAEIEDLFKYAKDIMEEYLGEELAIIDPGIISIQTDGFNRYLVELNSIGINNSYEVDLYYYYMVIQKNNEGRLYMTPFGIEIVKGEIEKVRKDLLVSMLKMMNNWGIKPDEQWKRWQEAML